MVVPVADALATPQTYAAPAVTYAASAASPTYVQPASTSHTEAPQIIYAAPAYQHQYAAPALTYAAAVAATAVTYTAPASEHQYATPSSTSPAPAAATAVTYTAPAYDQQYAAPAVTHAATADAPAATDAAPGYEHQAARRKRDLEDAMWEPSNKRSKKLTKAMATALKAGPVDADGWMDMRQLYRQINMPTNQHEIWSAVTYATATACKGPRFEVMPWNGTYSIRIHE